MYKYRHIISTAILTFVLTGLLCFTIGGDLIHFINASNGNLNSKLNIAKQIVDDHYINSFDKQKLDDAVLEGYVKGLGDPYAEYVSSSEMDSYLSSTTGNYKGIGVEVIIDDTGLITVSRVNENSPAHKYGIIAGDKIIKAEETNVSVINYDEAINIIKGVDDTDDNVKITIKRGDEEIEKNIIREYVESDYITEEMIGDIYYISISSFEGKSAEQFDAAVTNAETKGAKGIIVDLRNNPGGILDNVLSISDRILDEGVILTIKNKSQSENIYKAKDNKKCNLPICVLVNKSSASASEVFAAALKDNNKATVVGTTTYGKGVVQTFFRLDASSLIKITTAKYYTPNGVCIDGIGITPDITVELDDEYKNKIISLIPRDKDNQLNEALSILSKQ